MTKQVSPPSRTDCERYLREFDRTLRLGAFIKAGGAGVVYELEGAETPQVVKVIDTRFMADRDGSTYQDKELRRKCSSYIQHEIRVMESLRGCSSVVQIGRSRTFPNPGGASPSSYISVTLITMPKLIPLMQYLTTGSALTESDILQMWLDIGEALRACVREKIIHRDVKPDNIFVCPDGDRLRFVLGDFGVSRRMDDLGEQAVTGVGTGYYKAPEIVGREPLRYWNSDIYSLGVTIYYLLANTFTVPRKDPKTGRSIVEEWYQVPEAFRPFLEKALQADPEFRYHDPDEMIADLSRLCVTRRRRVVREPFATAVKDALCHNKLEDALDYAVKGFSSREKSCRRLLAYCLYRVDPKDERVLRLLNECFNEGDPAGILIRGMVYAARGEKKKAGMDIRDAALSSKQCVPAWYFYGRFLYRGNCEGIPRNAELGLLYIQKAAEHKYYPALRYLQRISAADRSLDLPPELMQLMQEPYSRDDERERGDIIRFL